MRVADTAIDSADDLSFSFPIKRKSSVLGASHRKDTKKKPRLISTAPCQHDLAMERKANLESITRICQKMAQTLRKTVKLREIPLREYRYLLTKVFSNGPACEALKKSLRDEPLACPLDVVHKYLVLHGFVPNEIGSVQPKVGKKERIMLSHFVTYLATKGQIDTVLFDTFVDLGQRLHIVSAENNMEGDQSEIPINILTLSPEFLRSAAVCNNKQYFDRIIDELDKIFAITHPGHAFFSKAMCRDEIKSGEIVAEFDKSFEAKKFIVVSTLKAIKNNKRIIDAVSTYYALMVYFSC